MNYRKDIDGLRAIAVLAVIANHLPAAYLPSGFLGVDVFFVISGFVITASLLSQSAGTSSLLELYANFFSRRVKRLLPALFVFVLLISTYVLITDPFPDASITTGIYALFGFSNIFLYNDQLDYFAASSKFNAFTHTWSLGVEEQFYLLFPFIVWIGLFRHGKPKSTNQLSLILVLISTCSLFGFVYLYKENQPLAYFMMPMRFWELGAGSLTYLVSVSSYASSISRSLGRISILLLLLLFGVFSLPLEYAVWATIASIVLTVLIILSPENSHSERLLSLPIAVFIGQISYSLYLWHWPVITQRAFGLSDSVFLYLPLMLVLAVVSFYLVEKPLRHRKWSSKKGGEVFIGVTCGLTIALFLNGAGEAYSKTKNKEVFEKFPPSFLPLLTDGLPFNPTCVVDSIKRPLTSTKFGDCTEQSRVAGQPILWVMGDSHAGHLQGLLYDLYNKVGTGVHLIETPGNPFPVTRKDGYKPRETLFQNAYSELKPGDLFLIPRLYFNRGKAEQSLQADVANWLSKIPALANTLDQKGVKLILIGPTPLFQNMTDIRECSLDNREICSEERNSLLKGNDLIVPLLTELTEQHDNIFLYSPFPVLCPDNQDRCYSDDGQVYLYRDKDHLNTFGAQQLTRSFVKFLRRNSLISGVIAQ